MVAVQQENRGPLVHGVTVETNSSDQKTHLYAI